MSDLLHVFVFEHLPVRGALVQLDAAWRHIRSLRAYPPAVERLLGESLVAAALLASTLKSDSGNVLLQIQGEGPLRLLVAECTSDFGLRCTARSTPDVADATLDALVGAGHCAITIGPAAGSRRYQGIVPLDAPTLAGVLEGYMRRSEQLDSRVVLFADCEAASGLLLQRIPQPGDLGADGWDRSALLAATVSAQELSGLAAPTLLRRLFPEDDVRLFDARALRFACSCSRARVAGMLASLGREEVEQVLADRGEVEVTCEFCGGRYSFAAEQCRALFDSPAA